jgi:TP901 family phage tail tape measure protein
MAEPIQRLFVEISADLSGLRKGLGQAREEVSRFAAGVGKIGSTLTKSVTLPVVGAATAAGAGITAFVADSVKSFAEFEKNLSGVRAVLGATEAEAKKLGDLAIKLGMDPRLVVTTAQAVQVMEELAKNGLTAQQILDGAARASIALANAAGVDFATAADVASTTMQLFNLRAQDMGRVVDMITGVANASRFSVDDFRLAIAQAGAMAASVGISIEDFATTIAALSTKFASGSDAGTSFKVFLQRLVPQSDKAKDAMKELGIITKDGRNQFFNAKGELRSMAEIAEVLRVSLSKLSDEQRIQALTTIFGTDAMRTAIGLMELGGEGFKKVRAEMEKTSAAENAAMRMKNLAGAMEILGGVIEGLKIKVGEAFAPAVLKVVQAFSDFLDANSERIQGLFASLAEEAGRMAERIVSALETEGPRVISFLEGLVADLPNLIAGLADIGKTVAGVVTSIAGALAMLPPGSAGTILAIVGALAVLGPALSGLAGVISIISTIIGLVGGLTGVFGAFGDRGCGRGRDRRDLGGPGPSRGPDPASHRFGGWPLSGLAEQLVRHPGCGEFRRPGHHRLLHLVVERSRAHLQFDRGEHPVRVSYRLGRHRGRHHQWHPRGHRGSGGQPGGGGHKCRPKRTQRCQKRPGHPLAVEGLRERGGKADGPGDGGGLSGGAEGLRCAAVHPPARGPAARPGPPGEEDGDPGQHPQPARGAVGREPAKAAAKSRLSGRDLGASR